MSFQSENRGESIENVLKRGEGCDDRCESSNAGNVDGVVAVVRVARVELRNGRSGEQYKHATLVGRAVPDSPRTAPSPNRGTDALTNGDRVV